MSTAQTLSLIASITACLLSIELGLSAMASLRARRLIIARPAALTLLARLASGTRD